MTRNDEIPGGYVLHRLEGVSLGRQHILLPARLHDEISAAREALEERALTEAEDRSGSIWAGPPAKARKKSGIGGIDAEEEEEELALTPQEGPASHECAVHSRDEPLKMLRRAKQATPDRDRISQLEALYLKLKERGPYRTLALNGDWSSTLSRLDQTHPHFAAVTQVVRERLTLARQSGKPVQIPPLLLLGMAGVGKTHYAQALAAAVGTSHRQLQFDTAVTDAALIGSEKRWANTAYGALFEEVVLGEHANPVIVLDELDKALRDNRNDALAPLHSLLERVTSCRTRDISLDFQFDASHVIWICTANDPMLIPQPLRTRMKEFTIHFPSADQSIRIAREVARKAVTEIAPPEFEEPADDIGVVLGHLTAREAYHATADAVARAVAAGRLRLERTDFPADVRYEDEGASGWLH